MVTKKNSTIRHFGLLGFAAIMIFPFIFMVSTALKPQAQIFDIPPSLIPSDPTFQNFLDLFVIDGFGIYFFNSFFVATITTSGTLAISSSMAYAFARLKFSGKEFLYTLVLAGMMVPPVMLIIPQFLVSKSLGLLNTHLALILVYICMTIPMQTFLLRGFFEDIPRELEEAAILDGASKVRIFLVVMLPLVKPGLAVVTIFTFLYAWDEFPWANVAVNQESLRTLPIALAFFQSQHLTQWGMVFAGAILAVIPVVLLFSFFQKYFVAGIASSGLKG
jgi:multiple sugar transport system permease protein